MLSFFVALIWYPDPDLIVIPGVNHPIRWYGLLFAGGFILGNPLYHWIYKREKKPVKDLESLLIHMVVGTVIGARLGHCLFYEPEQYLSNPIDILKIWEGGLASHGGAIGILLALYLYCRKRKDQPFLWLLDRMVIIVALGGAFIRTGNFMNSEIVGIPTGGNYGIVFARSAYDVLDRTFDEAEEIEIKRKSGGLVNGQVPLLFEIKLPARYVNGDSSRLKALLENEIPIRFGRGTVAEHVNIDSGNMNTLVQRDGRSFVATFNALGISRHPGQLYEAIYAFLLFLLLFHLYYYYHHKFRDGLMIGVFLTVLFLLRIVDEGFKENQVPFEDYMTLNMGQLLSIPFVLTGLLLLYFTQRSKKAK